MIRLAIRVRRADAELVLAELLELAPGGVEERELDGESVEFAVYGPPGELPELPDLHAAAGEALIEVSSDTVAEDWQERWKRFHRPIAIVSPHPAIVPGIRVRPPWEEPAARTQQEIEIEIEPGRAFGTGAHASTRLCLELLLELSAELLPEGEGSVSLCDLGTGSGVLAIAAARLGYGPVWALDNDPLSIAATRANARANDVTLISSRVDLREPAPLPARCDVLLANLLRPLLLELAERLEPVPKHLIAGGLLREEAREIVTAFARLGMRERARRHSGEWAVLWLQRRP